MDDAESEEVLLALGPQLTWKRTENGGFEEWMSRPQNPTGAIYIVTDVLAFGTAPQDVADEFRFEARLLFDEFETRYPTAVAAKTACERHHATGKWD